MIVAETLKTTGRVIRVLGNNNYEVEVEAENARHKLLCHLSGRMNLHRINVMVGDKVNVVIPPPYSKGRITFRVKE